MSYLGRTGSAAGQGQSVFGGGGGGAGGALSFPFSWPARLVLLEAAGRDPPEECMAYCDTLGRGEGKRP